MNLLQWGTKLRNIKTYAKEITIVTITNVANFSNLSNNTNVINASNISNGNLNVKKIDSEIELEALKEAELLNQKANYNIDELPNIRKFIYKKLDCEPNHLINSTSKKSIRVNNNQIGYSGRKSNKNLNDVDL